MTKLSTQADSFLSKVTERKGDWLQTFSGRQFWPLDPRADEIHIEDIAHALSMQCRYAGHCLKFYSVAEHSVHIAWWLLRNGHGLDNALWGLLHDASEAYLVDVPRPVKPYLAGYKDAEAKVMTAVCERFGLSHEMPSIVHEVDKRIIGDERVNMQNCVAEWYATGSDLGIALENYPPVLAEYEFINAFNYLRCQAARRAHSEAKP